MAGTVTAIFRGCQSSMTDFPRNIAVAENRGSGLAGNMPSRSTIRADRNPLRDAIIGFMKHRGLKATPWAAKAGVPESTFRSFLAGKARAPRHDTLQKLAVAADTTIAEIMGETVQPIRSLKDAIAIKSLRVHASMGGGFEVQEEPAGPPFFFRREWIETILVERPGRLRVHWFSGRSMEPTINDGDVGLVHLDYGGFEPGIYTLWDGRGIVAKRLEMMPGSEERLRVISDNPQYHPYEISPEEANVIGRILWRGGKI